MPHAHLLLILEDKIALRTPRQVEEIICARIPALPKREDSSPEAQQKRREWYMVTKYMLYDCNKSCEPVGYSGPTNCVKHFPKEFSTETILSGDIDIYFHFFIFYFNSRALHAVYENTTF